jgi:type IV pilus assembly protein PilM
MFGIHGLSVNYFLGIDFGTSSIKVVEFEYRNGSAYLSNYGCIQIPVKIKKSDFEMKNDSAEHDEKVFLLKKLLREMGVKSKNAHLSMGSYRGLSVLISINDMGEDKIDEIIKAEAIKYIPVSLSEVYLSFDKIPNDTGEYLSDDKKTTVATDAPNKNIGKKQEILLVAAPKDDVHKYENIIEDCDLKVASFELDIFSTVRSLVGDDLGKFLIVDIGAKITNVVLVHRGIIRISRNINVGGDEITKNIATNLNISWDRAEEFKRKNDYLKKEGHSVVLPILNLIARESKRVIDLNFSTSNSSKSIDNVILVGGGVDVPGIVDIFTEVLGQSVSIGNPFNKVIIENDKTRRILDNKSFIFATASGLAMKGIEMHKK